MQITKYYKTDPEYQSNSKRILQRSGSISNTQLNTNYKSNKTDKADHRRTPPILLNFIEYQKETTCYDKTIRNKLFVDICPYKCTRDNLDYALWPANHFLFCNPPWSTSNVQKWMKELKKFVEKKRGSVALLTKIDCSVSNYWFECLYENEKIDYIKYELKNNFQYVLPRGFKGNKKLKNRAPRGSILVIMQPRQENKPRKIATYPKDIQKWKQSMSNEKYNELERRQEQHRNMDVDYFRTDNDENIQIKKKKESKTLTQIFNGNVKDD
eukprot:303422_1